MSRVFLYVHQDTYIYFRDGEVRLIADVGDSEMVEYGIDAAGAELIEIENAPEIGIDINIENISTYQEKILSDRIAKHIKDNEL